LRLPEWRTQWLRPRPRLGRFWRVGPRPFGQKTSIDSCHFILPTLFISTLYPPLQYTGSAAARGNFLRWFGGWKSSIGVEIRDLNILASGDTAAAHMLHRTSGTLKDGREVGYWVRATVCCQRSDHRWLITHEHVSLPVDFKSGRVAMDLVP
jgi:ketosteroid isomerase-like protein